VKRLTDLASELSKLYRLGPSIGVDFNTIADHLVVYVAVKDAHLQYQYINLPGQFEGLHSPNRPGTPLGADANQMLNLALGKRTQAADLQALDSTAPVMQWSEPRLMQDGSSERLPQIKLALRNDSGQPIGVMDVAPLADLNNPDASLEIRRMNESLDLVTYVLGLLMRCDNETDLMERTCSALVVRGRYLAAAIVPVEGERRMAGVPLSLAGDRAELGMAGPFALDDALWEQHPVARAAESGLCVIHHCAGVTDDVAWQMICPTDTAQALIALPLKNEDEVFAVLLLATNGLDVAGPPRAMLLQRMADELSLGIELLRSRARLVTERKQREIHLRQQLLTSQRLSLATASADMGIWEFDIARGTVTMDERSVAQHGLPTHMHTLPLATMLEWVHPEDLPSARQTVNQAIKEGKPTEIVIRTTPPDGVTRVLRVRMSPIQGDDGKTITGALGTSLDITDHARHERQLRDLDAKLRIATEATGVGLWELDIEAQNVLLDGRTRQIYGVDAEAGTLSLSAWLSWVHPAQRQDLVDRIKDSQRRATRGQLECAMTPPDGRLRRVLVSWVSQANGHGEVIELVGTQVDVTERRRDEDRTAQTHQRLALLAGASGVGHWHYSLQDGFEFDEASYRMLGVAAKPHPAAAWLMEMCLPSAQREALELALITADDHLEVSLQWQGLDGVSRQIVWMGTVDRDARRTVIRGEGLCIDVTIQQQVNQSRREPALDTPRLGHDASAFTSRVTDELRSPLNAILGFVQRLRQSPDSLTADAKDGYLSDLEIAGRHLLDLVGDAMDLSRIESGETKPEMENVALIDLMGELLPLIEQQASQLDVQVELGDLGAWPTVHADRRMLKQALMYISTRAIGRSPSRGHIELRFEPRGAMVSVMVSDHGASLNTQELARVFDPFDNPAAGDGPTGMRLAIARHCAQAMGGQLQAANRPGCGVTFSLILPGAQRLTAANAKDKPAPREVIAQVQSDDTITGKVLYLEDNPSNVLLVSECLALRPSVELVVATTVQEALRLIRHTRFDLALLDLQLPDGDGYEVLRPLLDQRGHRTHCIAVTANAMLNERNRALEAGFEAFWTKPLDLPGFLTGVDHALGRQTH
jgi:signal transduction histidine kinase/CheY-like chemotaxis protein